VIPTETPRMVSIFFETKPPMPARVRRSHASVWRISRPWRGSSKRDKASVSSKTAVDREALWSGFRVFGGRPAGTSENATRHHGRIDILENTASLSASTGRPDGPGTLPDTRSTAAHADVPEGRQGGQTRADAPSTLLHEWSLCSHIGHPDRGARMSAVDAVHL
jgi:hypothetical protein